MRSYSTTFTGALHAYSLAALGGGCFAVGIDYGGIMPAVTASLTYVLAHNQGTIRLETSTRLDERHPRMRAQRRRVTYWAAGAGTAAYMFGLMGGGMFQQDRTADMFEMAHHFACADGKAVQGQFEGPYPDLPWRDLRYRVISQTVELQSWTGAVRSMQRVLIEPLEQARFRLFFEEPVRVYTFVCRRPEPLLRETIEQAGKRLDRLGR